jgi:predicted nucleotidyltransferase
MLKTLQRLDRENLTHAPKWMLNNVHYLTQMGSVAYAVSQDNSDIDVYGFCIPPKELVFPHLAGEIPGFGKQLKRFEQWQEHHVKDNQKEYDFNVYSIVKYFQLAMDNNPNMLDSIFVPQRCVLFCSQVGQLVRDNRRMFLHKGSYHKLRGYAYSQKSKIGSKEHSENEKRQADIQKFGYSTKYAYHLIRLVLQAEQILIEHDLDLERNKEILKSIRRGEWELSRVYSFFDEKEKHLEELYTKSTLRHSPQEDNIKELLLQCLEHHYGSLDTAVKREVPVDKMISELKAVLDKYS